MKTEGDHEIMRPRLNPLSPSTPPQLSADTWSYSCTILADHERLTIRRRSTFRQMGGNEGGGEGGEGQCDAAQHVHDV